MGKNINSLQLLRNTTLFTTKELAISGIKSGATNDGTVKLARYQDGDKIKTIFGICYNPSGNSSSTSGFSYTIYDSPQEVITKLTERLDTLQGDGDKEGSVANSIKTAIEGLDATIKSSGHTFVEVQVVETDGKITAVNVTENDIASAKLLGNIGDTADKNTAFGKIAEEADNRTTAITAAINDLDVTAVGGAGKVITTISETDGKISATAIDLTAGNVAATAISGDSTIAVESGTVATQIASLAKSIKSVSSAAKSYSVKKLTEAEVTALGEANVQEAYQLIDEDSKVAGDTIKIYKDSSLKEVALSGQTLNFTYILADGSESTVGVDVSTFLAESEFGKGLEVVDHIVNVKLADGSESFLTVGADGVKLSGVQTAINTAANKAATEVVVDNAGHVTVTKTTGANEQAIYTIGENDIASDTELKAEVNRAKAAEDKIEASVGLAPDGSHIKASGSNYTSTATTVVGEIAALDTALASEVTVRQKVEGQSGATYAANTAATYISEATSLNDADVKLDTAIKTEETDRKAEDDKIVAGVGLTVVDGVYKIAANSGTGEYISAASTVKQAIYTLDDAITAAKKANTLTKADDTVVVTSGATGTTVRVNIESVKNDGNKIVTFDGTKFIYSEAILDAGTY